MNILLVAPQPFYVERGTPIAVRLVAETLCELGHKVDLLVYHEGADLEMEGLRILRIPRVPGIRNVPIGLSVKKLVCDLFLCFLLWWIAIKEEYQVIQAVEEAVFPALLVRGRKRSKLIYDMDSSMADQLIENYPWLRWVDKLLYKLERYALRNADVILTVCEQLGDKAREHAPGKPVFVVQDIPLDIDGDSGAVDDLRAETKIRGPLALYVGNLEPYQGIELMLEGIAATDRESDLEVVVIGGDVKKIEHYRERSRQLGISGRTHFIGPRPVGHLFAYLTQADILLSPRTLGENTPMKIYSYMAAGKAILATDISSHRQVVDQECAMLVAPDPQSVADGLARLLADPLYREKIGKRALQRVQQRYSREAYRHKIQAVYAIIAGAYDR